MVYFICMGFLKLQGAEDRCTTEDTYSFGHLVLSHMGFANVLLLRPRTLNYTLHQFMTPFPDLTFYRL